MSYNLYGRFIVSLMNQTIGNHLLIPDHKCWSQCQGLYVPFVDSWFGLGGNPVDILMSHRLLLLVLILVQNTSLDSILLRSCWFHSNSTPNQTTGMCFRWWMAAWCLNGKQRLGITYLKIDFHCIWKGCIYGGLELSVDQLLNTADRLSQ